MRGDPRASRLIRPSCGRGCRRRGSRSVQLLTPMAMRMRSMAERAPSFCLSWVQLLAIGLVGDVQKVGDLRHRAACGEQAEDFELPRAQARDRVGDGAGAQKSDLPRHFRMQIAPAVRHRLDRAGEQRRIVVLGDIALGPGLDRARGDGRIVVHAEDDEPRLRLALEDPAKSSSPESPGRLMSIDPDLRPEVEKAAKPAAPSCASNTSTPAPLQKRPASRDDDRMVVNDENPHTA